MIHRWIPRKSGVEAKLCQSTGGVVKGEAASLSLAFDRIKTHRGAMSGAWEERIDPGTGRTFYINHQTREVSA